MNEQQVNDVGPPTPGPIPETFRVTGNHNVSSSLVSAAQNPRHRIRLSKTQTHQDAFATGQLLPKPVLPSSFLQGNF